ncbi:MAG: hypothetical protein LC715_05065 [Gammaproteobacteria bacterium]|nr:hypothetical protein [Gammaproteobacteria bacterium]
MSTYRGSLRIWERVKPALPGLSGRVGNAMIPGMYTAAQVNRLTLENAQ